MNLALDLDGTIISCKEKQVTLMKDILGNDFHQKRQEFWDLKRNGHTNKSALMHLGYDDDLVESSCKAWVDRVESIEYLEKDNVIADIVNLSERYRLFLITARKNESLVEKQLKSLGLFHLFSEIVVVNPQDVIIKKSTALIKLHCDLFIGDTETDFKAAQLANVEFVAVESGQRSKEYLHLNGVSYESIYSSLSCDLLIKHLENL